MVYLFVRDCVCVCVCVCVLVLLKLQMQHVLPRFFIWVLKICSYIITHFVNINQELIYRQEERERERERMRLRKNLKKEFQHHYLKLGA